MSHFRHLFPFWKLLILLNAPSCLSGKLTFRIIFQVDRAVGELSQGPSGCGQSRPISITGFGFRYGSRFLIGNSPYLLLVCPKGEI